MKNPYWKTFYIAWTPFRWVASFLWLHEWIPLGRFAPYVLGASICRWPTRAFDPSTCLELLEEVERLRECHATKGTHTIDCALAQKEAGTWGKKK